MKAEEPLLSCSGLTKNFGALAAIWQVEFSLLPGEVLGIGGPNGAGKTTLFDLISGLTPVTSGSVRFDGRDVTHAAPWELCQAGLARTFQLNASFETLTVEENVLIGAYYGYSPRRFPGLRVDARTRARVDHAIELVGLTSERRRVAGDLPVLARKLLMIASAVATGPKLLLMDEPVGGLNPEEIARIGEIIGKLRAADMSLIVIEHVMRFLVQLSTRMMILHHGEIIYQGSPAGLVRDKTVVEVYLGAATSGRLQSLLAEPGP